MVSTLMLSVLLYISIQFVWILPNWWGQELEPIVGVGPDHYRLTWIFFLPAMKQPIKIIHPEAEAVVVCYHSLLKPHWFMLHIIWTMLASGLHGLTTVCLTMHSHGLLNKLQWAGFTQSIKPQRFTWKSQLTCPPRYTESKPIKLLNHLTH